MGLCQVEDILSKSGVHMDFARGVTLEGKNVYGVPVDIHKIFVNIILVIPPPSPPHKPLKIPKKGLDVLALGSVKIMTTGIQFLI